MNNQKGFVLIEFVIALPLILMLLYGLAETTLQIYRLAKAQAADYMLAVEAQEVLTRITEDLRAAKSVTCYSSGVYAYSEGISDCDNIEIKFHTIKKDAAQIIDVIDTRVYTVAKVDTVHSSYIYRQHQNGYHSSPITGGNFFGDTEVTFLKYEKIGYRTLHIALEMRSIETKNKIKLSTAVFMPACEKIEFL